MKFLDDVIHIEQIENGYVYHYTTLNALKSILDNNEFLPWQISVYRKAVECSSFDILFAMKFLLEYNI